ncbi:hypothetical protein [Mesorhizobium sp. LNJC391B00]|uniref:hypothetical protein n=1 Tax=Mesorhizobium sp. LNJC391B00 TaxID=1287273 RepID=UPI000416A103|nr:hypothetical protein [Mesorhizobium sp. LNJC391B00]
MKTSIATDLSKKLNVETGFNGSQIFEKDFPTSGESLRQVGKMVRDQGLTGLSDV